MTGRAIVDRVLQSQRITLTHIVRLVALAAML